jgi:uronate dehydrogenase
MKYNQDKTILITGSAGSLGKFMSGCLQTYLKNRYNFVVTDTINKLTYPHPFIQADITNIESLRNIFKQYPIDIVVHFAGKVAKSTPWEQLLPNNIVGVYNILQVASEFKCQRVVLASSINAVNGYQEGIYDISEDAPINPKSLYGATKAWLEAVAHLYANERNLSCICIRFGRVAYRNDPGISILNKMEDPFPSADRIITYEDATQLTARCIEAPSNLHFFIAHGVSENEKKRISIDITKKVLDFKPVDNVFNIARKNESKKLYN